MKTGDSEKSRLQSALRQLMRSMDFIADGYLRAGAKSGRTLNRFGEIYQQLGLAWEHLGLQCRHWNGYRRMRDDKQACRICGHIKGSDGRWVLLPRRGTKQIGRMATPTSQKVFANKKAASIITDAIRFAKNTTSQLSSRGKLYNCHGK